MSFGTNVRTRRKKLRLSQVDLSRSSGIPQSTISALEIGERIPTEITMTMIAKGLRCSVSDLLDDAESKKEPAINDAELFKSIIPRILCLSGPALLRVSDFLDSLQDGQETAAEAAAAPGPDDPPAE